MEELKRLELLIGNEAVAQLQRAKVLVLGVGGVGSYAVEALTRSGIGTLILVDYDQIDRTNLNRQLMTNQYNIGKSKVDVWEERIHSILPTTSVIKINEKIMSENIDLLFINQPDFIIDACDTIETKKELLRQCKKRGIGLISSMGTGNKMDPAQLEIVDLRKTEYDPIAKIMRKMVKEERINGKVMVVCSKEKPMKMVDRIIGSTSFVPATAGLLCASYVVRELIKKVSNEEA